MHVAVNSPKVLRKPEVPESTVQCLVGSMEELVDDIHAHAKETVVESLSSEASGETLEKVQDSFGQLENPFSSLNTESKRKKHLEEKCGIGKSSHLLS